jgi:hypothetical protein
MSLSDLFLPKSALCPNMSYTNAAEIVIEHWLPTSNSQLDEKVAAVTSTGTPDDVGFYIAVALAAYGATV